MRLSVTDRCNLRCRYCMPEEGVTQIGHDEVMRFEEIVTLVRAAASVGFQRIRLTGGEPLIRRDITELVRMIGDVKGLTDLSMTTNGVLLEEKAEELFNAGIRRVNISLDTLVREKFLQITRRDEFDAVMRGIDAALSAGMDPVKINVVLIRDFNDDEIFDFIELTKDRPLSVRFIEYMPMNGTKDWNKQLVVPLDELRAVIKTRHELDALDTRSGAGPSVDFKIPGFSGTLGFITPVSCHFCDRCNRIRVTADGRIRSCLFSDDEAHILPLIRGGNDLESIGDFILEVLKNKPKRHHISSGRIRTCQRSMSEIGG
ncbi:MAG: GTP 3',8-cyclase MoaA [Deltaproteobacteria bacterium]|nr:GTP 3',8-cyclase MoaA [Candidatus Zymogenaceae bacterium]